MSNQEVFVKEALPNMRALRDFAFNLCRDAQRANDLVQDTMVKAIRRFDTYQPGTNCRAWLFQICKYSFINDRRRHRLEPVAADLEGEGGDDEESYALREIRAVAMSLQEDAPDAAAFGDEVTEALSRLSPDYHTALLLSDVEGYSYEEIAEYTQAPIGTVRSRIHRARKTMASRLRTYARREGIVRRAA